MARLRVKDAAERRVPKMNLNQLYQAINEARTQRGEAWVALGTVRRYWHSTEKGDVGGTELDQISWAFMQETANVIGCSVYELLPSDDGLGNLAPELLEYDQAA